MKKLLHILLIIAMVAPAFAQRTELKERRTPNSRTYYDQQYNRYITHMSTHDIHYLTDDGVYEHISPYLRTYPDRQWGVYKAPYRTRLASRLGEGEYDVRVEFPEGGLLHWRIVSLGYYDRATGEFAAIESARPMELQNGSNVAIYPGIFAGMDYRVVHTNTGVRQEFVRSSGRKRELPQPLAYGLAQAELAIRVQASGDREWSSLLPFQDERRYLSSNVRDGLLLIGKRSGTASAAESDNVLLETTFRVKLDETSESALRFDLETSGVPKNAAILSARVLSGGMNQDVKEQAERWLAEPESNQGLAELQKAESTAQQAQMLVEWVENSSKIYFLKDHLGSVRVVVDETGAVVGYDDYDPWGLQLAGRSMTTQANLVNKFTGKERDTDFGLDWDYFGRRYYDAVVGRFLGVDPVDQHSLSAYHYAANNPLIIVDPAGADTIIVTNMQGQSTAHYIPDIVVEASRDGQNGISRRAARHSLAGRGRPGILPGGFASFMVTRVLGETTGVNEGVIRDEFAFDPWRMQPVQDSPIKIAMMPLGPGGNLNIRAMARTGDLLELLRAGRGLEVTKQLSNLSKTKDGQTLLLAMEKVLKTTLPKARSAQAASLMRTLQRNLKKHIRQSQ